MKQEITISNFTTLCPRCNKRIDFDLSKHNINNCMISKKRAEQLFDQQLDKDYRELTLLT